MNEFKYYDIPSPFPTLARGLFSVKEENAEEKDGRARYRIIARGCDKFFNIGSMDDGLLSSAQSLSDASFFLPVVVSGISHKVVIHSDAQV